MEKFTCDQCKGTFPTKQRCYGYGKVLCSLECFREAGTTYKPNNDTNRGGGVGKPRVTI